MHIALEPEGTLLTLTPQNKIAINITSEKNPAMIFSVSKEGGQITISLWPDKGTYEVVDLENFMK